jgi:hypothetical protein
MALPAEHDRDRAVASLRRHYLLGRLSGEELSDRLDLAFAARSRRELRQAFRGLPAPWSRSELEPMIENTRYAARRTLQFTVLAAFWSVMSLMLLVAFVAVAANGASGVELAIVPLIWVAVSALLWRSWQRGASR